MTTQKRVGVIGWPVEHSLSPAMHNAAFRALGMDDWLYDLVPIPPDILRQSLRTLKDEGGYVGVNVTVPHKERVLPYVRPDDRAQAIGAVNTIDFRGYKATNTDVVGFMNDLAAYDIDVEGANVLVIGAGGAARAAVYGLAEAGGQLSIVNRTQERAQRLINDLNIQAQIVDWRSVEAVQPALIVNCTSVGMWPKVDDCVWPDDVSFPEHVTVYDMVYRPQQTRLMTKAEARGGRAITGLGMLVRQGAAAFEIWTGNEAPVDVMFEAVEAALRERAE
ncbi:MAG: shikimate dehydrogenase [Phototrophicales bacterium]|nr:MAG: shikimate dehydrogenase [Phototrophicales bacterium]